jgi:hypothetical protein
MKNAQGLIDAKTLKRAKTMELNPRQYIEEASIPYQHAYDILDKVKGSTPDQNDVRIMDARWRDKSKDTYGQGHNYLNKEQGLSASQLTKAKNALDRGAESVLKSEVDLDARKKKELALLAERKGLSQMTENAKRLDRISDTGGTKVARDVGFSDGKSSPIQTELIQKYEKQARQGKVSGVIDELERRLQEKGSDTLPGNFGGIKKYLMAQADSYVDDLADKKLLNFSGHPAQGLGALTEMAGDVISEYGHRERIPAQDFIQRLKKEFAGNKHKILSVGGVAGAVGSTLLGSQNAMAGEVMDKADPLNALLGDTTGDEADLGSKRPQMFEQSPEMRRQAIESLRNRK